ncbi:hypothetical protein JG687_00018125 [Phytophthora cactorum]|uniref:Uncharacterized protein n=1 Tax=Phytophthora cactorum TaxID=29920 RepID=A0A8T1TNC5_9STRA|nr:hypothetical protein JG687_00018125 [Phytophthora cactorum]
MPHTPQQDHGRNSPPRSAGQTSRSHRDNAPAHRALRSHTAPVLSLSVADYHLEHRRRHDTRSMIRQATESKAPDSSEPRAPDPRERPLVRRTRRGPSRLRGVRGQ